MPLFWLQGVREEAGVATSEMTGEIDSLEGVTLVDTGTAITIAVMTINLLVQILKMAGMAAVMAPAMVSLAMATDSQLLPTRQQPFQARTTSRPSSFHQVRMVRSLLLPTPHFLSLRHKRYHSTLHRWCPMRCHLSSLSKSPYTWKKYLFLLSWCRFDI